MHGTLRWYQTLLGRTEKKKVTDCETLCSTLLNIWIEQSISVTIYYTSPYLVVEEGCIYSYIQSPSYIFFFNYYYFCYLLLYNLPFPVEGSTGM